MEKQFCANPNCIKHTEHRGGKFVFKQSTGETFCEDCYMPAVQMDSARNLWDFTTTHFTGEKVHVRNLKHLDQLCAKHGVSNHARENMKRNW